jgi:hypothetical protein
MSKPYDVIKRVNEYKNVVFKRLNAKWLKISMLEKYQEIAPVK